jgi:multidrug resistance efflux pump
MSQTVSKDLPAAAPEALSERASESPEVSAGIAHTAAQIGRLERLRQEFEANAAKAPALRTFQEGRLRQLKARSAEIVSELAVARANRDAAQKALARVEPMASSGSIPAGTPERYRRDAQVTAETYTAIEHRLAALQVELKAAESGTFIGDTYNDQPRSAQRIDEIGQRLNELNADLRDRDTRMITLRKELTQEEKRLGERAEAVLTTPVAATVWEVLTSPGEAVVRGQDLVRLLDCSGTVVPAGVSESVYNRLHIGQ